MDPKNICVYPDGSELFVTTAFNDELLAAFEADFPDLDWEATDDEIHVTLPRYLTVEQRAELIRKITKYFIHTPEALT